MGLFENLSAKFASNKKIANITLSNQKLPVLGGFVGTGTATTIWNGLSTTGKVLVGAGVGATGYAAYDWFFGKKAAPISQNPNLDQKQSQPVIVQPVVVQPNNPVNNQYDYSQQYNQISNSPYASIDSKKSMGLSAPFSPTQYVPFAISPQQTATASQPITASQGTDWATLAAIAGAVFVIHGYVTRKGK